MEPKVAKYIDENNWFKPATSYVGFDPKVNTVIFIDRYKTKDLTINFGTFLN